MRCHDVARAFGVVSRERRRRTRHRDIAWIGAGIVGSLAWGRVFDGYPADRFDLADAAICLVGVAVIMYAPRS